MNAMWAGSFIPHLGSLPFKKWLTYMFAAVAVALLYSISFAQTTYAADATWDNGAIRYNNAAFSGPQTANGNTSNGLQLANGVQYYISDSAGKRKIIYFDANKDPNTATDAKYTEYNFSPPDNYSNQTTPTTISIDKNPGGGAGANDNKEQTSCAVNGIGYILCPIMGFMADAMDWVFDLIKGFLEVRPLSSDTKSSLYQAWAMMRAIANVAFVVAFLVFVYAYLTSMAMSAYDIRKMIPRLIIAAFMVNTSYYICAVLVDLSNIAGASLQDVFMGIRDELATSNTEQNKLDGLSWSAMTAYILSGGTIAAAGLVHLSAVGTGLIYMLVPILIATAIAIFVTLAVLAARQALIIILIVIAPIAFVAFVLPGTQKYFDKWRDLFQTMLMVYPMFAVLFGGSQLAGYLISQNASRPELLVLAMFVQVAPLIITPFLIKFSGSLLGRLAGMVNNPSKGMLDKGKNWASDKQDKQRARRLANHSLGSGLARRLDDSRRRDEALKKRYETRRNRKFNASDLGRSLSVQQSLEDDRLAKADNLNKSAYEELKRQDPKVRAEAVQVKIAEMEMTINKAKMETYLEELQTEKGAAMHGSRDVAVRALSTRMRKLSEDHHVNASRASIAGDEKKSDYANDMVNNRALQRAASGVGGTAGEMLAMARATQAIREDFGKSVGASTELLKHFGKDLNNDELKRLAYGGSGVMGKDSSGRQYSFDASTIGGAMHEAAATKFMQETNAAGFEKFVQHVSENQNAGYVSLNNTVKDIALKQFATKIPYMAGKSLDLIDQGKAGKATSSTPKGEGFIRMITQTIEGGKLGPEKLVNADASTLQQIIQTLTDYNSVDPTVRNLVRRQVDDGTKFAAQSSALIESARNALTDDRLKGSITASVRAELEKLKDL
jgi:hypothetical protein